MKKTKFYLLIIILIILVSSSIYITYSYFYQNFILPNEFKTMTYNVNLTEEFNDDWGIKKVFITNNESSNTSVVLRIKYIETWSKVIDNEKYYLSNTINGTNVVDKEWTNEFLNDFIDGNDGWYYYKKVLDPNSSVQLLNSISLNTNLIEDTIYYQDYLNYDYNLIFGYESIALDSDKISDIWNKSIIVSGSNITWS